MLELILLHFRRKVSHYDLGLGRHQFLRCDPESIRNRRKIDKFGTIKILIFFSVPKDTTRGGEKKKPTSIHGEKGLQIIYMIKNLCLE